MAESASKDQVPLKKVVLYKHGMGYFERRGAVNGAGSIELLCGASDIDDMLKSLMVLSEDGARIDAITYDSAKTLEDRMQEFGFDVRNAKGLLDIVIQMKGLPVSVMASGTKCSGRVVGIDFLDHVVEGGKVTKEPFLVLLADATFRRLSVSSISSISVDDDSFSKELNQQLELLFQNARKKDRKALTISLPASKGEVVVAYTIPSPIWKTSYRLVMTGDKLIIQGMAIVDNVQDEDWQEVQMVLVSAAPISFIQPLYEPIQPWRATIDTQGYRSSGPVVAERAERQALAQSYGSPPAAPGAAPQPQSLAKMSVGSLGGTGGWGAAQARADGPNELGAALLYDEGSLSGMMDQYTSMPVDTSSSGELFEYRVSAPVSVPRNTSALIPIVQGSVEGKKISLYNQHKHRKHPYCAIRLRNTTGLTLEGGPVTILEEDAYAGEALLDVLKPNDKRFLPYALDQDVHVIVRNDMKDLPLYKVRLVHGNLFMDYRTRSATFYRIENVSSRPKTVYVEHPVVTGMKLVGDAKPAETTENYYRFEVKLNGEELHELAVTTERELSRSVRLLEPEQFDRNLVRHVLVTNDLTSDMKRQLEEILSKQADLMSLVQQRKQVQARIQQYAEDQNRARENLKALGSHNERYRQSIDEAEDRIMKAKAELEELNTQYDRKRTDFHEFVMKELEAAIKA